MFTGTDGRLYPIDFTDKITEAVNAIKTALVSTDAAAWLAHRYETDYGIFNHDVYDATPEHEMPEVRLFPSEDTSKSFKMSQKLKAYLTVNVLKYTGITFTDFIQLPRHYADEILVGCEAKLKEDNQSNANVVSELQNVLGNTGKP